MNRLRLGLCVCVGVLVLMSCGGGGKGSSPTGPGTDPGPGGNPTSPEFSVTLAVSPADAGSITPSEDGPYEPGDEVSFQAEAAEGYVFSKWSGDAGGSENPLEITVEDDLDLTANFVLKNYELAITTEGDGDVSEAVIEEEKAKEYAHGTLVELTAVPGDGWKFVEWKGAVAGTETRVQVRVDSPKDVTAVFEEQQYSLDVSTAGEGTVALAPGQQQYTYGTAVELNAKPADGWEFDYWEIEGDEEMLSGNPLALTIRESQSITAVFRNKDFAGGVGTEARPYQVETLQQLQNIGAYLDAHFIQTTDIDAATTAGWNGGAGFQPIGKFQEAFTGFYNGGGFQIQGLVINRPDQPQVGLFGYVKEGGIRDVRLLKVDFTGSSSVGGLAGNNDNGVLEHVILSGSVQGNGLGAGGVVGINSGEVRDAQADVEVTGSGLTGGIVGQNTGTIRNSWAKGSVSGEILLGGLVGNNAGTIEQSHATGNVTVVDLPESSSSTGTDGIGGLVGRNFGGGAIRYSYAEGEVSGENNIGGLVGYNGNKDSEGGSISYSYSTGAVTGEDAVGGLVGIQETGSVSHSMSSSTVSGKGDTGGLIGRNHGSVFAAYALGSVHSYASRVGGLIGANFATEVEQTFSAGPVSGMPAGGYAGRSGEVSFGYWDSEASGQDVASEYGDVIGAVGLTTAQMTGAAAEQHMAGFDFEQVWRTTEGYPVLSFEF